MKKTIATGTYLLVFFMVSAISLQFLPQSERYALGDPSHKVEWIGHQIEKPSRTYDYVFIGSSHIWNAINTEMVGQAISTEPDGAINLGMNWGGRDRDWIVARDFIQHHNVRNLVIECDWMDYAGSHSYLRYLASPLDMLLHPVTIRLLTLRSFYWGGTQVKDDAIFVASRLADIGLGIYVRILRSLAKQTERSETESYWDAQFGFLPNRTADGITSQWRAQQKVFDQPPEVSTMPLKRSQSYLPLPHEALKKIAAESKRRGVRLIMLFVPTRANRTLGPEHRKYFESFGAEVIPFPREILVDPRYWTDDGHLGPEGARLFTEYFIRQERMARGR